MATTTLSDHVTEWLQAMALRARPSTCTRYAAHLRRHVLPTLGADPLLGITRPQCLAICREMLRRGYAPNTIRVTAAVLNSLFADAVDEGIMHDNPARALCRRLLATTHERDPRPGRALSVEEFQALIAVARRRVDTRTADLIVLLARTGLRIGEALALEAPLTLDGTRLYVSRTWLDGRFGPTKTGRARWIDLTPQALAVLLSRSERPGFLFPGSRGSPWTRSWAAKRVWSAAVAAGLSRITPHLLRHTYGTWMRELGAPLDYIQMQMGHATLTTTSMYAKTARRPRPQALGKLDRRGTVHAA